MKVAPAAYDKLVTKKLANKVIKKAISQNSPKALKNSSPKVFKCKKCGEGFENKWCLLKHKCKNDEKDQPVITAPEAELSKPAVETPKKELKCLKCKGLAFPSEAALKHHNILHSGFKPYTCNVCNITFENETKWQSHIEQSAKQSHCEECLQYFGCLIAKQRHVCLESSYFCTYCGAQFKKRLAFDRHLERCKLKMDCNICGRKFVKRGAFKHHMQQIHDVTVSSEMTTSTPQPLKETPNIFTTIDNYIKQGQEKQDSSIHIESETIHLNGPVSSLVMCSVIPTPNGKKAAKETSLSFECEVCHRCFASSRAKHIHQRIHPILKIVTTEFKSLCETCNKRTSFKQRVGNCKTCLDSVCSCANPSHQFTCTECSGEYKKIANEDLICQQCQEIFDSETDFNEHSSSHNNDATPKASTLNRTSRRSYKCGKCNLSFRNLKAHRRTCRVPNFSIGKGGGQKVSCLQCEKVFSTKIALASHLKFCGNNVDGEDLENNELKRLKSTLNESALLNASGSATIECNKCMKIFRTAKHLEMHDKQVHKDYQCEICNMMFWKDDDLINHLRVHKNAKRYPCDCCEDVLNSTSMRRKHRYKHFQKGDSIFYPLTCKHCDVSFANPLQWELHIKKLTIGPDGKFIELSKPVSYRNKRKFQNDVSSGSHAASSLDSEEPLDDLTMYEEENKEENVSILPENQNSSDEISPKSRAETPTDFINITNYPTSPSIFESEIPDEEDDEEMEKHWRNAVENGNDSDFESTVEFIETSRKDEVITHDSNLAYLAVKVMDNCIRSKGTRRASVRVRKIIKDVFKLIVDHPVTIERPHTCAACGKLFIFPQGITNHYYRKHGAQGILHSLSLRKNSKVLPVTVEKKSRRQRKLDQSKIEAGGDVVSCRQVESNVSPKDEPVLIELRNNISKLLCHLVSDSDVLAELGWPQRLIDDVLIDVISRCESRPSLDARKSRLSRLRENITTLLSICVKEQAMENFGWNEKPVDEVVKEMLAGGEIATV